MSIMAGAFSFGLAMPLARPPRLAARPRRGVGCAAAVGELDVPIEPYRVFKPSPDEPPARADDHLENHLLSEENRRLKDELRRAEHALKVAAKVLGPYFK